MVRDTSCVRRGATVSIMGCCSAGSRGFHGDEFFLLASCSDKYSACGFALFPVAAAGDEFVLRTEELRHLASTQIYDRNSILIQTLKGCLIKVLPLVCEIFY